MNINPYYDETDVQRVVEGGGHREAVGGLWETIGRHQMDFLMGRGLQRDHRLLDVGCGALRLGVHAVAYLNPAHYFGLDLSPSLIDAGYRQELDDDGRAKLPRAHLAANADFDLAFVDAPVDMAIAQSVFTHLPLNHVRRCLAAVAAVLKPGGVFYATAWVLPEGAPLHHPFDWAGTLNGQGITTSDIRDPYHHAWRDIQFAAEGLPLGVTLLGDWGHPRGQPMLAFLRR